MNLQRFGLTRRPFSPTPDSSTYYPATPHEQALAPIVRALENDEGLALLVGEPGVGKTLVGQVLLERLGGPIVSAFLPHSHYADRTALLQTILFDLGLPYEAASEQTLRLRVTEFALKTCAEGKRLVAVVDEAHLLSPELLEELRLLGNLEAGRKAFQVVCLAQHPILQTLKDPRLGAWNQRLSAKIFLPALTEEDAADYLVHQIRIAGAQPENLFDDDALATIAGSCRGVPRLLNQAATQALVLAEAADLSRIDVECAHEAIHLLGLETETEPTIETPVFRSVA